MPIIELSNKKQILVQENDFPNPLKWEDAINFCQNTKGNWRLPSIEELVVLHEKKKYSNKRLWLLELLEFKY